MKKMLVAAGVLAVITGVVAAVCKNRKKYTKVRTNYQEDSVKNPYMQDFSHARFVSART